MRYLGGIQRGLSDLTFGVARGITTLSDRAELPVLSTGRPFSFYRKAFFHGQSEAQVFAALRDQTVLDIGCGLTPFVPDSFFQRCYAQGIDVYGIDPKLSGFDYTWLDQLAVLAMRGRAIDPNTPGEERRIGAYANDLPFESGSVDLVLSSWFLYIWINEAPLQDILQELHRVLRPGGQIRITPTPSLDHAHIRQWVPEGFDISQRFHITPRIFHRPPAYTTTLTKKDAQTRPNEA